jgi:hypothetical protein
MAGARPASARLGRMPFMPDPTLNRSRPALSGRGGPCQRRLEEAGFGWFANEGCFVLKRVMSLVLWPWEGQRLLSETRAACFLHSV